MTVTIRKLDKTDHDYFAYTKSLCGKATYLVYFQDDIWGAMILHNFIDMLMEPKFYDKCWFLTRIYRSCIKYPLSSGCPFRGRMAGCHL